MWSETQFDAQRALENEASAEMSIYNVNRLVLYSDASHSLYTDDEDAAADDDEHLAAAAEVAVSSQAESFIVLGSNISKNFDNYNKQQQQKFVSFFDVLERVKLHPQLSFTLARFCGFTKARYYAAATPPEHSESVLTAFNNRCTAFLEKLFDFEIAGQSFAHHKHGLGIPDYLGKRAILYSEMRNAALLCVSSQQVQLVNVVLPNEDETARQYRSAQEDAFWLQYQPTGYDTRMRPEEFRIAMAIRCRTLPRFISDSGITRCECGFALPDAGQLIDHSLNCGLTGFTPSHRHSLVKTAVAQVLRRFNFAVSLEPSLYHYSSGDCRPDLTVWAPRPVATDFVISQQNKKPGVAATEAAKKKIATHRTAVTARGHVFVPFALEAHGYEHASVQAFVKQVAQFRPKYEEQELMRDIRVGVSVALARARMNSILALVGKLSWRHQDDKKIGDHAAHDFDELAN